MNSIPTSCSCCGGNLVRLEHRGLTSVYSVQPYDLVRCTSCSNLITVPVIPKEDLAKLYSSTYLYPVHLLVLGEKRYRARGMARYIRSIAPAKSHAKLLEVGCMFGYLLEELRSEYAVKGIEIGAEPVRCSRAQGLDVMDISLEDFLQRSQERFDVIVISHVLEHLLHPDEALEKLRSRLNSDGVLIIAVPNPDSFCARLFGRYWGWWQVPVHINHFNQSAIEHLARRTSWDVKTIDYRGGDSLMWLLNFINLFHFKNDNKPLSPLKKLVIKLVSSVLRYWYILGNEELRVVLGHSTKD